MIEFILVLKTLFILGSNNFLTYHKNINFDSIKNYYKIKGDFMTCYFHTLLDQNESRELIT